MENTQITPGIYHDVSFETYLSWDCFHKSMVASALRSTLHLEHFINSEFEPSKVMDFGSLVDCLLLEPKIFDNKFREKPETYINNKDEEKPFNANSNWCKAWIQEAKDDGVTSYKKEDYSKALDIIESVNSHKTASQWINAPEQQVAVVWLDEETGIMCKARLDLLKSDMIVDVKTTANASSDPFARIMNSLLYHVQASMYQTGLSCNNGGEVLPFNLIVAETEAPFCVATYNVGEDSLHAGNILFRKAIRKYKDYLEIGPTGYSDFPDEIDVPRWALNVVEELTDV